MKKTATEYLFEKLWETPKDKFTWQMILNQAKEIEKYQIQKAFDIGLWDGFDIEYIESKTDYKSGKKYYQETYGKDG